MNETYEEYQLSEVTELTKMKEDKLKYCNERTHKKREKWHICISNLSSTSFMERKFQKIYEQKKIMNRTFV